MLNCSRQLDEYFIVAFTQLYKWIIFWQKLAKKKQTNKREQDSSAEMSFKHLSHWITGLKKIS